MYSIYQLYKHTFPTIIFYSKNIYFKNAYFLLKTTRSLHATHLLHYKKDGLKRNVTIVREYGSYKNCENETSFTWECLEECQSIPTWHDTTRYRLKVVKSTSRPVPPKSCSPPNSSWLGNVEEIHSSLEILAD